MTWSRETVDCLLLNQNIHYLTYNPLPSFRASLTFITLTATCPVFTPTEAIELRNINVETQMFAKIFLHCWSPSFANRSLTPSDNLKVIINLINIITIHYICQLVVLPQRITNKEREARRHSATLRGFSYREFEWREKSPEHSNLTISKTEDHSHFSETLVGRVWLLSNSFFTEKEIFWHWLPTTPACSNAVQTFPLFVTCGVKTVWEADILCREGSHQCPCPVVACREIPSFSRDRRGGEHSLYFVFLNLPSPLTFLSSISSSHHATYIKPFLLLHHQVSNINISQSDYQFILFPTLQFCNATVKFYDGRSKASLT